VAGFLTGGEVLLEGVRIDHMGAQIEKLKEAGAKVEILGIDRVKVCGDGRPEPLEISTAEYPGFPYRHASPVYGALCGGKGHLPHNGKHL